LDDNRIELLSTAPLTSRERWCRRLISAFILFNITAVFFGVPKRPEERNFAEQFFNPYLKWTRLNQQWRLFVPEPRRFATKYRVEIEFMDGTRTTWQRPYPPNWDFFERHLAYNFQKWDLVADHLETSAQVRMDLAKYIQRNYQYFDSPAKYIKLIRARANWPDPHPEGYAMHEDSELAWQDHILFNYSVSERRML
jgi:hypothetical protein